MNKSRELIKENELYNWCLEQASARFMGKLSNEQIDKLNSIEFPWAYYEEELDKLGYHWSKNKPRMPSNCNSLDEIR